MWHDDDYAIADTHSVVTKDSGLEAGAAPELRKRHSLAFVFVDPGGNKWAIRGCRLERLNKTVELFHPTVIVSGEMLTDWRRFREAFSYDSPSEEHCFRESYTAWFSCLA